MTTINVDIAILGAGMTGASLVHLLRPALAQGLTIALLDRQALQWQGDVQSRPPSFDGRATALSFGTQQLLDRLGVWSTVASSACAIEHIQVSDQQRFGQTHLHASEQGVEALGYVIENAQLGAGLLNPLRNLSGVQCLAPSAVDHVQMNEQGAYLRLNDGRTVQATLLVMADGGRSPLAQQLGITYQRQSYGTQALVTQVASLQAHEGWAYERFSREGPIAFLPLSSHQYAVVWTLNNDVVDDVLALDDATFLSRLQQQIGHRVGRLQSVGERLSYPLALVTSTEQMRRSLVLLGNAAHSLHPVAGQGFNLAMRDCARLAEHILDQVRRGGQVGDLAMLQRYQQAQASDQRNTIAASDVLPKLFASDRGLLALARDGGLLAMSAFPTARRLFARHAMGLGQKATQIG